MDGSHPPKQKLNILFPKIRVFNFDGKIEKILHNDSIVGHFPHLQDLDFSNFSALDNQRYFEKLAIFLCLGPYLRLLNCYGWSDAIFDKNLRETNELFHNLEEFNLIVHNMKNFRKTNAEIIHLKNVKFLCFGFEVFGYKDLTDPWVFPFRCDKLEELILSMEWVKDEDLFNMIDTFPNLKKCTLHIKNYRSNYSRISKCPLLEEIYFEGESSGLFSTIDEIVYFVNGLQSLKVMEI